MKRAKDPLPFGTYSGHAFLEEVRTIYEGQCGCVGEHVNVEWNFSFDDLPNQVGVGEEVADADAGRAEDLPNLWRGF